MAINKELLAKVKAHILEEPRRFNMDVFGEKSDYAPCGTVACIAGWTIILAGEELLERCDCSPACDFYMTLDNVETRAADLLNIAPNDTRLFYTHRWPESFATRYREASDKRGKAEVAADLIDEIIRTGEVPAA